MYIPATDEETSGVTACARQGSGGRRGATMIGVDVAKDELVCAPAERRSVNNSPPKSSVYEEFVRLSESRTGPKGARI